MRWSRCQGMLGSIGSRHHGQSTRTPEYKTCFHAWRWRAHCRDHPLRPFNRRDEVASKSPDGPVVVTSKPGHLGHTATEAAVDNR